LVQTRGFAVKKKKEPVGTEDIPAAVALMRQHAKAKFDETVEMVLTLKIDPRKANEIVRGVAKLPHGTGKQVRVAVFAKEDRHEEAIAAGAHIVGEKDLAQRIREGELDFDQCVATPDMMAVVGSVARILGPRGLMPSPKLGTVTTELAAIIKELQTGRIDYRNDKTGNVHAGVGKVSFDDQQLLDNLREFVGSVITNKPDHIKGDFIKGAALCSTQGPGIRILPAALEELVSGKAS